jgi:hypothetical protein
MSLFWAGFSAVVTVVGVSLLAGCASAPPVKEEALTKPLAPMSQADRAIGYKVVRLRDGKEEVATLVEQTAETQTWTDSSDCRYVLSRTGFAPVLEFSNCDGGNTGTQTVKLVQGKPYPLALGGKWAYSYSGQNTRGNKWTGHRECSVQGSARVKTGSGEHDTYKVVCEDNQDNFKASHTFYVAPALQTIVIQERYRVRYWQGAPPPDRTRWEFVRQQ